jgi:Domain of unknown function (DUF397)
MGYDLAWQKSSYSNPSGNCVEIVVVYPFSKLKLDYPAWTIGRGSQEAASGPGGAWVWARRGDAYLTGLTTAELRHKLMRAEEGFARGA